MLKLFSNLFMSLAGLLAIPILAVLLSICFVMALLITALKAFVVPLKAAKYAEQPAN